MGERRGWIALRELEEAEHPAVSRNRGFDARGLRLRERLACTLAGLIDQPSMGRDQRPRPFDHRRQSVSATLLVGCPRLLRQLRRPPPVARAPLDEGEIEDRLGFRERLGDEARTGCAYRSQPV